MGCVRSGFCRDEVFLGTCFAYVAIMTGDQIAQLLYLVLLGSVIAGYFFLSSRHNLGKSLQQLLIWGMIFLGAVAIAGLWPSLVDNTLGRQMVTDEGTARIEIPRSIDGHYHLRLEIEGTPVRFVVDTGATDMVLSHADAERAGIDTDALAYTGRAQTANGVVPIASVVLDEVRLAGITDRNVRASVNGGEMSISLLGMRYLQRFSRIEIEGDRLILSR